MSVDPSVLQAGTQLKTVGPDGTEQLWVVREDGKIKQANRGRGLPDEDEEGEEKQTPPPKATQLPS